MSVISASLFYLLVSLFFLNAYMFVNEDTLHSLKNYIDGLYRQWRVTKSNRRHLATLCGIHVYAA